MGVIVPSQAFLKAVRLLTRKYGIVLIFDEVMTGFRTNLGGVQADCDIIPDLTCLGKIIGGGYPVGAYGGRADIMRHLSPLGHVYQAGTFAGNPLVMRAGLATLTHLTPAAYKQLNVNSDQFVAQVNKCLNAQHVPAHLINYKSMISIRLRKEPVLNYADAQASAMDPIYSKLFHYLLRHGVYWPPANLETFFVSGAHLTKDLNNLASLINKFFIKS